MSPVIGETAELESKESGQMRIGFGSVLIVLIVVVGGFGYLLYGYLDTSEELKILQQQIIQLQQQNKTLQELLNEANANIDSLNVQNDGLEQQILSCQEQARQLQEQKQVLEEQMNAADIRRQDLEKAMIALQEQLIAKQSSNTIENGLPKKNSNPYGSTLLLPFVPVAVVTTYIFTRQRMKSSIQKNQRKLLNNMQGGSLVKLSDEELKTVIKMRRGQ
jgi:chromosome segregation ATPase